MFKFEDMKKLLLLLAVVFLTISALAQQNDTTRYRYDVRFKVYPKPAQTITPAQGKWLKIAIESEFKKNVIATNNDFKYYIRNVNLMAIDSTFAEILDFEYETVSVFGTVVIEAIVENKTLDLKYHCWYVSGMYQNHPYTESFEPYNNSDWHQIP